MTYQQECGRIHIALVDDQELIRDGIAELLGMDDCIEVAIMAANGVELIAFLTETPVDVIVMDVRMPGESGIETVRTLRRSGNHTPVLILTTFDEPELLLQSTEAGAQGFMLKDTSQKELIAAIRLLSDGGQLLQPVPVNGIRARHDYSANPQIEDLTDRELEVLRLMAGGYTNRDIASALHLAEGTIKNYVSEILVKLGARDRTKAVLTAITNHIL